MPFDGAHFPASQSLQKLEEVIDLIATPDRWCKGALRSHDGRYCIRGAIRAADAVDLLEPVVQRAIIEIAGRRFRRIEAFNDHPNTGHEQVIAVLARARDHLALGLAASPRGTIAAFLDSWRAGTQGWLAALRGGSAADGAREAAAQQGRQKTPAAT